MNDPVHVTREAGIVVCRLDRPPVNAIDVPLSMALETVLGDLAADDEVDALVLTGTGSCFSAGLDLKRLPNYSREEQNALLASLNRLLHSLYSFPRPVVAGVNGHAIAGGFVLMLACDHRIGPQGDALFGLSEGRVGVAFPVGALEVVRGELEPAAVRRYMLGAENVDGATAVSDGALDELVPADQVLHRSLEVARAVGSLPRGSYPEIKRQLRDTALERIRRAAGGEEPLLGRWLGDEVPAAVEAILRSNRPD
jgi:enoyl-CoA hydratase